MCGHRYSKVTCAFSLIKFLTSVPFWAGSVQQGLSEPKHEIATIEREFKFRKIMAFSVLASLRTVTLHSTLVVNNSGLKFVS